MEVEAFHKTFKYQTLESKTRLGRYIHTYIIRGK